MVNVYPQVTPEERARLMPAVQNGTVMAHRKMALLLNAMFGRVTTRDQCYLAAEVVVMLDAVASMAGIDLRAVAQERCTGVGFLVIDLQLGRDVEAKRLAATANIYLANLIHTATLPLQRYELARDLGRVTAVIERLVDVQGGDLWFIVDRMSGKERAHG